MKKTKTRVLAGFLAAVVVLVTNIGIIPAAADVNQPTTTIIQTSNWKRTNEDNKKIKSYDGIGAWNYDQVKNMQVDKDHVWDGGTWHQNFIGHDAYSYRNDITWASWEQLNKKVNLRLFKGVFTIPVSNNEKLVSVKIGTIGEDHKFTTIIPINDNIYIYANDEFVYKGGTGYPGTVVRNDNETHENRHSPYRHTDGWHVNTQGTSIDVNSVIDNQITLNVFAEETSAGGGMSELVLQIQTVPKDIIPPVITIAPYNTKPTNKDITVAATTNEGTLNAVNHTFTENGSFEFVATDSEGNVAKRVVTITNIDKISPVVTISPYSTNLTNKDITVTATTNEGTLDYTSHTFTENGTFAFTATDNAGNSTTQSVVITNINKTKPVITIGSYEKNLTNKDITVTATTDKGTLDFTSHTFTENGTFVFKATDELGNEATSTVTITNIDKVAPIITIMNYNSNPTNNPVIVTAKTDKGTLNEETHTFTKNGEFTFVATDLAGNVTSKPVTITNIDTTGPAITIGEYNMVSTNQDVIVTATTEEGSVLNETSHTFTQNGSFPFVATDSAGNKTTKIVEITNIDKTAPVIMIGAYETNPTNKDVEVPATTNEGTLNANSHIFTENGDFTFIATDSAGNSTSKSVTITNIDKVAPIITIGTYEKNPTNKDIEVTATAEGGTLVNSKYTFTSNGSYDFIATDSVGNKSVVSVTITNIDKTPPVITIGQYETNPTNKDITVTATSDEGSLNSNNHVFTENGAFDFTATDSAGNVTTKTVSITNIDKTAPIIAIGEYETGTTNKNIIVTAKTNEGTLNSDYHIFTENGSFEFIATDSVGNITTKIVTITNIKKDQQQPETPVTPIPTPRPERPERPVVVVATPVPVVAVAATATPTPVPVVTATPTPVPAVAPAPTTVPIPTVIPAENIPAGVPTVAPTPETTPAPEATPIPEATPTPEPIVVVAPEKIAAAPVVLPKDTTPGAPTKLPKTGGVPETAFYGFGAGLIALGVIIRKITK